MPLSMLKEGEKARVVRVGGAEAARKHLGALGFVPGAIIRVVSVTVNNMIIAVHDSRIAINGETALHVFVESA